MTTPQIRIVSEGSGTSTRVYNEDGTEIRYVSGIDLRLRPGQPNRATVEVFAVAGEINAEVEAIRERLVPEPSVVLVVRVAPRKVQIDASESYLTIERHSNRGTDHTLVETVCEGWVSACDPFELTVPEVEG